MNLGFVDHEHGHAVEIRSDDSFKRYRDDKMRIALVCSHGGHLSDLLFLLEALSGHDFFFVTYDSPRTRSLSHRKYFLPNFSEKPAGLLVYPMRTIQILRTERPDVIISDGAEIAIPFFYLGKALGIKTVFIESYTRIEQPTITGRLVYPVSDLFLVFWPELLPKYGKRTKYWGGLLEFTSLPETARRAKKEELVLVTVGMHYVGFERLVRKMDEIAGRLGQRVFMQIGSTQYRPKNADYVDFLEDKSMKDYMSKARLVVCQGAMSAVDSICRGTPVIAVPRLKERGEVINDHQIAFSRKLQDLGLVTTVEDIDDLEHAVLQALQTNRQTTNLVSTNARVVSELRRQLDVWESLISSIRGFSKDCSPDFK